MSSFYLCDYCDNCKQLWVWANEVDCKAGHDTAKVMYDHHGRDGKRYDEPTDVCKDYEQQRQPTIEGA
jgi:hypothetical protein